MPNQILYTLIVIVLFVILVKLVTIFIYKDKEKSKSKNLMSIAIVDSHKLFRKAISMALSRQGFQILFEASDGKEVIDLLKSNVNPDIALVSTHIGGMNAIETVRLLQEFNPEIKILVLYMDPLHERPEKMIEAGAHGCIAKTADPEEIRIAILEILNKGIYRQQRKYAYRALNSF
ncbi:response regulator [Flavitalea sp.]|nr:response regulator transcription factor [Flavitalea sp.]